MFNIVLVVAPFVGKKAYVLIKQRRWTGVGVLEALRTPGCLRGALDVGGCLSPPPKGDYVVDVDMDAYIYIWISTDSSTNINTNKAI